MIHELWKNRDHHPLLSSEWFRAWAKRLVTAPGLARQAWFQRSLRASGADIHCSAFFSSITRIEGDLKYLSVGAESFVGRVQLAVHESITVGCRVCINDGARLLTATHDVSDPHWGTVKAPIVIEDYAWIATDAMVLPGVTVGRGAVIGAGAVVAKNVPAGAIMVGNPARQTNRTRAENLEYSPTALLALNTAWRKAVSHSAARIP
jgi:acetyltransferase-like isoleucine patch superfamily enzyme